MKPFDPTKAVVGREYPMRDGRKAIYIGPNPYGLKYHKHVFSYVGIVIATDDSGNFSPSKENTYDVFMPDEPKRLVKRPIQVERLRWAYVRNNNHPEFIFLVTRIDSVWDGKFFAHAKWHDMRAEYLKNWSYLPFGGSIIDWLPIQEEVEEP